MVVVFSRSVYGSGTTAEISCLGSEWLLGKDWISVICDAKMS